MPENPFDNITLGQHQAYVNQYDAQLLQPVSRSFGRNNLAVVAAHGCDVWTGYELSWLDKEGRPQVVIAEFKVPATSSNIIESKSFKYYLNSFNQTPLESREVFESVLQKDLSAVAGAAIDVRLYEMDDYVQYRNDAVSLGRCIDMADLHPESLASPSVNMLEKCTDQAEFSGVLYSHLFKSNCPVTGQPDWASIWLSWQGVALTESSVLRYLISFRQEQDFHEHCVERIYSDLWGVLKPKSLWVYARYTRRGGLDINPFRSSHAMDVPHLLAPRQ